MNRYQSRLAKARENMQKAGAEALVLSPSRDLFYFTGYDGVQTDRAVFWVLCPDRSAMILPSIEGRAFAQELRGEVECIFWQDGEDPCRIAASYLEAVPGKKRIAVGGRMWCSLFLALQSLLKGCEFFPADGISAGLRATKDESEIEAVRKANQMAERALKQLVNEGFCGKTELALAQRLSALCREEGLGVPSDGLVASGPNGAFPHHKASGRVIRKGDAVLIDFGGSCEGYLSDISRTFAVGSADPLLKEVYALVLRANLAAKQAARPGASGESVDSAGRDVIQAGGYGEYFTHRLGHGLGLDGHEAPCFAQGDKGLLEPGNIVTDEPGIYLPGKFGVRIEDDLLITENGCVSLTSFPRELTIVD